MYIRFFPSPPCVRTFISQTYSLVPWEKWRKHLLVTLWLDMCTRMYKHLSSHTWVAVRVSKSEVKTWTPFFLKIVAQSFTRRKDVRIKFKNLFSSENATMLVASNDLRRFLPLIVTEEVKIGQRILRWRRPNNLKNNAILWGHSKGRRKSIST